jgi:type II secretory ATPase GspE/PulE/Tfp pilus assembly ATPase PilB-like protein
MPLHILTAEDPVELNMAGINRVQMREQIGLNFAAALRHRSGRVSDPPEMLFRFRSFS